ASDGTVGPPRRIIRTGRRAQLSRPSVHGSRLAYTVNKPKAGRIVIKNLDGGGKRTVRTSRRALLAAPALGAGRIAFVVGRKSGYQRRLRNLAGGGERRVLRRGRNRPLTATAIGRSRVYVTELVGHKLRPRIISATP